MSRPLAFSTLLRSASCRSVSASRRVSSWWASARARAPSGAAASGSLSDRIGRIPTIIIGWIVYALVYLGFALSAHAALIWLFYGLYGVYYATNQGVIKAFLADLVPAGHRGRAFGIYGTAVGLATLLASAFAGFLWDHIGPQAPFYFGVALALAAVLSLAAFSKQLKVA